MKKISSILLVVMAAAMIMPSCKKYEDGPTLSLRSKKARLVNEWKVDRVYENAIDITTAYIQYMPDYTLNIKENGEIVNSYNDQNGQVNTWSATWAFNSDKSAIIITTGGVAVTYDITRLKNDELWLKKTYTDGGLTTVEEVHYITK